MNATIVKRHNLTEDLFFLFVKPDANVPDFLPGQYVALGLYGGASTSSATKEKEVSDSGKIIKRAYSIGSAPHEKNHLEFYIAAVPNGELSGRIGTLNPGDRVFVAPKVTGTFTLKDVPPNANLVFVATGTGIAPFMSMLRTPSTWQPGRKITIIHGVRYVRDLAYVEELNDLAASNTDFRYFTIVSRPDESWKGERGHVQKFFNENTVSADPAIDHIFLCGNPAMIDDMEVMLTEQKNYIVHSKRTPGSLHLEKYW